MPVNYNLMINKLVCGSPARILSFSVTTTTCERKSVTVQRARQSH